MSPLNSWRSASSAECMTFLSLSQGAAQDGAELGDLALRYVGRQRRLGPVERAGPLVQLNRDARLQQAQCVHDSFVAVRVELRGGDVGRWEAGQIDGPSRGRVR